MPLVLNGPSVFNYVFVLDSSSSMFNLRDQVISGYNENIDSIKELSVKYPNDTYRVSLLTFSNSVSERYVNQPITNLGYMEDKDYSTNGCTALFDAIGYSIELQEKRIKGRLNPDLERVVITVFTDGFENASVKYKDNIATLVSKKKEEGWVINLVGAGESVLQARSVNIGGSNVYKHVATPDGMAEAFRAVSKGIDTYTLSAKAGSVSLNFFEEGDEDHTDKGS